MATLVQLARPAMGTRFELLLADERREDADLRAVGEAVLDVVEEADRRLSAFRRDSVVSAINRRAAREPVRIDGATFALLERCLALHAATEGAFDPTIGPWLRHHGLRGEGAVVDAGCARAACGAQHLELDSSRRTVRFHHPAMELDLGAVGKGHALELALEVLSEHEIANAFLHGGTSSLLARGRPPGRATWTIAVTIPSGSPPGEPPLAQIDLDDRSLAVSAPHGRTAEHGGTTRGHVIDPRDGRPVDAVRVAGCVASRAVDADAWATAWLVLGAAGDPQAEAAFDAGALDGAFAYRVDAARPWRRGPSAAAWRLPDVPP